MAHVHGEKAATQIKSVVDAGTAKMMDSMMKEGVGPMTHEVMGPMMKMGEGMAQVMTHVKTPGVAKSVATGAVATAGASAGKSAIGKVFTHPLVLFGLGVAVGYFIFSYRKSIIEASEEAQQEE